MNDVIVDAARSFVEQFVVVSKRERYLKLLRRKRTYEKFLREIDHLRWLDDRYAHAIPRGSESTEQIERILREHGAPDDCIVISADDRDCGELTLKDALATVVGATSGAIVSCIPGKLAYYEAEEPFERYLCIKPS